MLGGTHCWVLKREQYLVAVFFVFNVWLLILMIFRRPMADINFFQSANTIDRYILPIFVAIFSFVLRWLADFSCSSWSQTCRASSDLLSHVYMVVFFFLIIVASTKAKQISDLLDRVKAAVQLLSNSGSSGDSKKSKND